MTDERLEIFVGNLLRAGVVIAAAVVLAGGAWYLAANGAAAPNYAHFRPRAAGFHSISGMRPSEIVMFSGLLLLIATPIFRVGFTLIAFVVRRDAAYIAITTVVLAVLLYSIGTSWL